VSDSVNAADVSAGAPRVTADQKAVMESTLGQIGNKWWLLLILGIVSLIAGIVIVLNPGAAVLTIAVFFGAWLLVSGIFTLVRGFADDLDTAARVLAIISGALSIVLGIMCFKNIANSIVILTLFIGIGLILRGLFELIIGVSAKGAEGRGWVITLGVITLLAGIAVLVWPGLGLSTLVYLIGFSLILMGIFEIIGSFKFKNLGNRIDDAISSL